MRLIFDCLGLFLYEKLVPPELTEITLGIGKEKKTTAFINDSFKDLQAREAPTLTQ